MANRGHLCPACIEEELARSAECRRLEKAAVAAGEAFECTCGPLPCDRDPNHAKDSGN